MFSDLIGWGGQFLHGTLIIVGVFFVSLLLAALFGLIGASAKLSTSRTANKLAAAYTIFFRGTPEFLLLLLIYFGSAATLTSLVQIVSPTTQFVDISPFWSGSFAISLIVGASATETFRGAFLGVDRGQIEAAHVLGLGWWQTLFLIRLPQMWRLALPSIGNHMSSLVKDTSLISLIGLQEIMFTAEMASTVTSKPLEVYLFVSLIYLAFTTLVALVVSGLEKHANRHLVGSR